MRPRLAALVIVLLFLGSACGGSPKAAPPVATTSGAGSSTTRTATSSPVPPRTSTTSPTTTSAAVPATTTTRSSPTTTTTGGGTGNGQVTSEGQLINEISAEGLTPLRAEELFALDIGPLPGVTVSGITPDNGFDGTTAVMDLYGEWSHLTPAQQAAATALLRPARVESNVPSGNKAPTTVRGAAATTTVQAETSTKPVSGGSTQESVKASASRIVAGAARAYRYQLTGFSENDYMTMALQADASEAGFTHAPAYDMFQIEISDDMTKAYAETSIWDVTTLPITHKVIAQPWPGDACHITVFAPKFQGLSTVDAEAIMAHEVFHCYQQRQAGSFANTLNLGTHAWVTEGEATWVMLELFPTAAVVGETTSSVISDIWSNYANTPTTKYCDRSYDAVGVYGHAGDVAGGQTGVWNALLPMVSAVVGSSSQDLAPGECSDISALKILMGADSDRYYSSWGASYYEDQSHTDWHMATPGTPPSAGPSPQTVTINNGDAQEIGLLPSFQAQQTEIDGNSDILEISLPSGYGEVHDTGYTVEKTLDNLTPLALCLKEGGCKCPDGSAGASEITIPAKGPVYAGLDGGDSDLAAYAAGESLKNFCKDPNPPPPNGGGPSQPGTPGGGGTGGDEPNNPPVPGVSWGDPHLRTFDGRLYDFQAAGEFTLVRSVRGDFDVQVRQVPAPGSNFVAYNQAVAARVGHDRVVIEMDNGTAVARVDGVLVHDQFRRVGSGTLENLFDAAGGGFLVEWPDGSTLQVGRLSQYALNLQLSLAPDLQGKLEGLLGDGRHAPTEDYFTSSGRDLGSSLTPDVLYSEFGNSWRITQQASLFDYRPGQSTKTFAMTGFPRRYVTAGQIPNHALLEAECRAAGITDKYLLQDCIIDHSTIPGTAVLNSYAQVQIAQTVRQNIVHHLPAFGTTPTTTPITTTSLVAASTTTTTRPSLGLRTLVVSGQVNDKSETPAFTFAAKTGDIIWFGAPSQGASKFSCVDGNQLLFALVSPSGRVLDSPDLAASVSLCGDHERYVLPETGTYKIIANPTKSATGTYNFSFEFERPDIDNGYVHPGETVSGQVPDAATHVVYHLKTTGEDFLQISGPQCYLTTPPESAGLGVGTGPVVKGVLKTGSGAGVLDCSSQADPVLEFANTSGTGKVRGPLDYEIVVNWNDWGPGRYHFTLRTCKEPQIKFTKIGRSCPSQS